MNYNTTVLNVNDFIEKAEINQLLPLIIRSLEAKGYNAVNQLVGYLISNDPTYITTFNDARNMIKKLERDDILEHLITFYLEHYRAAEKK